MSRMSLLSVKLSPALHGRLSNHTIPFVARTQRYKPLPVAAAHEVSIASRNRLASSLVVLQLRAEGQVCCRGGARRAGLRRRRFSGSEVQRHFLARFSQGRHSGSVRLVDFVKKTVTTLAGGPHLSSDGSRGWRP